MKAPLLHIVVFLALCASAVAQTVYENLKIRNPLPTPNHLTAVELLNGKYVAVGESGTVVSSSDGLSWELHPTGYEKSLNGIAYGNGIYMAPGADNNFLLTSANLTDWDVTRQLGLPFNPNGITFHDGKFWICGSDSTVATSTDGETWTTRKLDEDFRRLEGIAYGGGLYITVAGDTFVSTSPDGETWTERPTGLTLESLPSGLLSVQYINGVFVVGGKEGTLLTSPDAITWTQRTTPSNSWIYKVIYEDGKYYFGGRSGIVYGTTDFITWDEISTGASDTVNQVIFENGLAVGVGRKGSIRTSADFSSWEERQEARFQSVDKVRFINGQFVVFDFNQSLYSSPDGITWTLFYEAPESFSDFIFADGKYVLLGYGGEISQSADGASWSPFADGFGFGSSTQEIRYLNDKWIAFGTGGTIRVSSNLTSWEVGDPDDTTQFRDVAYANGLYVACGTSGEIFTSVDALSWLARESGVTRSLNSIAWNGERFVIAGTFIQPLVSSNGIEWSNESVSGAPSMTSLDFQNGLLVGVGLNGRIGISQDGLSWSTISAGVSNGLSSIAAGNDRVVVSGSGGLILGTDPLPKQTLTLLTSGSGTVAAQPDQAEFDQGSIITITATPAGGQAFVEWTGDASGSGNPLTVTMDTDKSITAVFMEALGGYDLWKLSEFNSAERADDAVSGPEADPDGDGRRNVEEYYLASAPKSPDPIQFLTVTMADLGGGLYPVISHRRKKDVVDVITRVEVSNDLETWRHNENNAEMQTLVFGVEDGGDGSETVSYRTSAPLPSEEPVFLRVVFE